MKIPEKVIFLEDLDSLEDALDGAEVQRGSVLVLKRGQIEFLSEDTSCRYWFYGTYRAQRFNGNGFYNIKPSTLKALEKEGKLIILKYVKL